MIMKKIILFGILMLAMSCKKDLFEESIEGFKEETLSTEFVGNWRWVNSIGGWGSILIDTASKNILTIEPTQTYKWCKNDTCSSGKLFLGSRKSSNPRFVDTFLFFEKPKIQTSFPLLLTQSKPIRIADTLFFFDACNDCFSHQFIREKK
jgi:hypothetical protein